MNCTSGGGRSGRHDTRPSLHKQCRRHGYHGTAVRYETMQGDQTVASLDAEGSQGRCVSGFSVQRQAVKYPMVDIERGAMAGEEAEWHGL